MALLHVASLTPSKLELLTEHLARQPWAIPLSSQSIELLAAYRFDDVAGEVGMESHLIQVGTGLAVHIPLTYRAAPLTGAEHALLGTMHHSVLGERWIYDATADPVYVETLLNTIIGGLRGAKLIVDAPGGQIEREATATVVGTGGKTVERPNQTGEASIVGEATVIPFETFTLNVLHVLDDDVLGAGTTVALLGTWADRNRVPLACITDRSC